MSGCWSCCFSFFVIFAEILFHGVIALTLDTVAHGHRLHLLHGTRYPHGQLSSLNIQDIFSNYCALVMPLLPPDLEKAPVHLVQLARHPMRGAGLPCCLDVEGPCRQTSPVQHPLLAWSCHHGAGCAAGKTAS